MKQTALITGASSGIGKALAHQHAAHRGDLVLVARRLERLRQIKRELEQLYPIKVEVFQTDLTDMDQLQELVRTIDEKNIEIEYLINNAGLGGHGLFSERDWQKDYAMLQLNCASLTFLSHHFLPRMLERNSGRILNIASTAAWFPGPLQSVYFATKAYVRSLSWALVDELKGTNVTVTLGCPGPTLTEFASVAEMEGTPLFSKGKTPEKVAEMLYRAMMKGKPEIITDTEQKLLIKMVLPFAPMGKILKEVKKTQIKSR